MLKGLFGRSGEATGTLGACLMGPRVLEPWSGEINSFAVHVEASRIGLDMTGLGAGFVITGVTSSLSWVMSALILFWTELLVRLMDGLVFGLVEATGTTGRGGALLSTGFRTP